MVARTFTLGRYTCVERLGSGPAGETWRAKRFGLVGVERQVVVHKVGPALAKDASVLGRLATALKNYGELDGAALLRLVEFNATATDAFSVWEFPGFADLRKLRGAVESELEKDGDETLWPALTLHIGRLLSSSLSLAHAAGLWHGLLSPSVIWLVPDGTLRISELGFAPLLPAAAWTQDSTIKTLASYVPPEVLSGSVAAGPENDIFALGVILGELLTQSPSGGSPLATALREIADRARTTTRSERFASMGELAAALASLPTSEGLETGAQDTLVRQTIGRVAEQFRLAGDTVPQAVTISERSSAEPLPPPPGKSGDNKLAISARNRISALGETSGKTSPRDTSKPTAASQTGVVARGESEDTPLPQSRPLLLTNPKIPAPADAESDGKGAETAKAAAPSEPSREAQTSKPTKGRPSGKHRSGIDWLTSQSDSVPTEEAKKADQEPIKKTSLPPRPPPGAVRSTSAPPKGAGAATPAAKDSGPSAQVGRASNPPGQGGAGPGRRSNPVSVNPKARPASTAAASANTPTADQDVALAAGAAPADKAGSSGGWGRSPDTLSLGETRPALAPVNPAAPDPSAAPEPPAADSAELLAKATAALREAPQATDSAPPAQSESSAAVEAKAKRRSGPISEPNARVLSNTAPAELVQIADGLAQVDAERAEAAASPPTPSVDVSPALPESPDLDLQSIKPKQPPILVIALGVVAVIAIIVALKFAGGSSGGPATAADGGVMSADAGAGTANAVKVGGRTELLLGTTPTAQLYFDGVDKGTTPQTIKLSAGSHKLVLVAEGYKLLRREVSEGGKLDLKLDPARLPEDIVGPSEVKVKCKTEGKLRILVDGHDSGLACPTEVLSVSPGKHTLVFENPADGSRNEKKIKVKKGKKPTKVKVKF